MSAVGVSVLKAACLELRNFLEDHKLLLTSCVSVADV